MSTQLQPLLERNALALAQFLGTDRQGIGFTPDTTTGVDAVVRFLSRKLEPGAEVLSVSHIYPTEKKA